MVFQKSTDLGPNDISEISLGFERNMKKIWRWSEVRTYASLPCSWERFLVTEPNQCRRRPESSQTQTPYATRQTPKPSTWPRIIIGIILSIIIIINIIYSRVWRDAGWVCVCDFWIVGHGGRGFRFQILVCRCSQGGKGSGSREEEDLAGCARAMSKSSRIARKHWWRPRRRWRRWCRWWCRGGGRGWRFRFSLPRQGGRWGF